MKLEPLKGDMNWYAKAMLTRVREGNGYPDSLTIIKEIGSGSNNRVYRAINEEGDMVAIRIPRRKSDTEKANFALREFKHTLIASRLGVAPVLYDAWYNRHAKKNQKAGLYFIQEHYPCDMLTAFSEYYETIIEKKEMIADKIGKTIKTLADSELLCYDLKPGNIVVNFESDIDLKFIDFGNEFCEYSHKVDDAEKNPVTNLAKKLSKSFAGKHKLSLQEVQKHLLYCLMIIILSSITTYTICESKTKLRMNKIEREKINVTKTLANNILDNTRGDFIKLLKELMRQDDIKEIFRHYLGRRNAGTRRVFRLARGIELN